MVMLIRRIWTAVILLVIFWVILAGAPEIWSTDARIYLAFLICAVWAPVAFVLTMVQQATGKSTLFKDESGF
ncbi:MAG: hypothetical protein AAGF81_15705 [Pseudomonadota bacterium]